MTNNIKIRESILRNVEVKKLLQNIDAENSSLANVFGIQGMGKDFFLNDFLIPLLESKKIQYLKPESSISMETMLSQSKQIVAWIYSEILDINKKINTESKSAKEIEKIYFELRKDLKEEKSRKTFAILVNDVSKLPFDDLDWFQSVVLDTISSSLNSIIVVTSQNELNWHSWEMRNKCLSIKLPAFNQEEIFDLCRSNALTKKIYELSDGHPATVVRLIRVVKDNISKDLSLITKEDIEKNNKLFYDALEDEINSDLNFNDREWLREVFKLTSIADGFDADLVSDIINASQDTKIKDYKKTLDEINDIASEMAYTGLAEWDFNEKTYKVLPELRERIIKYMEYKEKIEYSKVLETIANSYLVRAEILPNKAKQIVNFMVYFSLLKLNQNISSRDIIKLINGYVEKILNTSEDYTKISDEIIKRNIENPDLRNILLSFTKLRDDVPSSFPQPNHGDFMNISSSSLIELPKSSMSREDIKDLFQRLITGEINESWAIYIEGEGGIGKTHLLTTLKESLKTNENILIQIDLHNPAYRSATPILRKVAQQANIFTNEEVLNSFKTLESEIRNISQGKSVFAAESSREQFDKPYINFINAIKKAFEKFSAKPVIFIDTLDESVIGLSTWFLPTMLRELRQVAYFVIAGRLSAEEIGYPKPEMGIVKIPLGPLSDTERLELTEQIKKEGFKHRNQSIEISEEIINSVSQISEGSPLTLLWILFYLIEFEEKENWQELVISKTKKEIFDQIAETILLRASQLRGAHRQARAVALKAAANFGSHFNLEIFTKSVPINELENVPHEIIYKDMEENFFYIRGTNENSYWTLHDKIREWLLDAYADISPASVHDELRRYSINAIENYYSNNISELRNINDRSSEQQDKLDDLKTQQLYYRILIETESNKPEYKDKPLNHHKELWNYLDYLWDHYRHYQMSLVIKYCEELINRWGFIKSDLLLNDILHAAQSWLSYSQTQYEDAEKHALQVREESRHRRLKGTVNVVLGLLPSTNPDKAFNNLEKAKDFYKELVRELRSKQISSEEFTDDLDKIYPELHLVLLSIGRTHLRYFIDLNTGIKALEEAFENSKRADWNKPLYSAVALNEWARILRFQGNYSDALNKIMSAILIYKKERQFPENFVNFGYFYETLGLIYKELSEYEHAIKAFKKSKDIYVGIPNILETRKATITLEMGEVYVLSEQYQEALEPLEEAHNIFKKDFSKNPWYYFSSLNKLGRYYRAVKNVNEAKKYFNEQSQLAEKYNHHLWKYWAELSLAEIDYDYETVNFNKTRLQNLFEEYSMKNLDFGPVFWRTKYLLYRIAKDRNESAPLPIEHLTEGLTYLSEHWRSLFWQNLVLLRNELLDLESKYTEEVLDKIIKIWKRKLPKSDLSHPFIKMCEDLRETIIKD